MKKFRVALACSVGLLAVSCSSGTPKRSLPIGRAKATMTSCRADGDSMILTGKVTNPLPKNAEVIEIDGAFSPKDSGEAVPVNFASTLVELGPRRVATFTIQASHMPNYACRVQKTIVDFVLIPGIPFQPVTSGSLTGNARPFPTPTSLVGQPLRS